MRLGLLELPRAHGRGVAPLPGVDPSTDRAREEMLRRLRGPRAEADALPPDAPAWRAADGDESELGEVLARGVGRSITSDGLQWLLQRHQPGAATPVAALQLDPPPSVRPEVLDALGDPSPAPRASSPRPSGRPRPRPRPRPRRSARHAAGA